MITKKNYLVPINRNAKVNEFFKENYTITLTPIDVPPTVLSVPMTGKFIPPWRLNQIYAQLLADPTQNLSEEIDETTTIEFESLNTPTYLSWTDAFRLSTGITDEVILSALNVFEQYLEDVSLKANFKAIYPFVGGTDFTHSFNFVDPALYELTFYGGWIHSATGVKPNGTNGYASTGLAPSLMSDTSTHVSSYIRESLSGFPNTLIGVRDTNGVAMIADNSSPVYYSVNDNWSPITAMADPRGLILANRIDNVDKSIYRNGSLHHTQAIAASYHTTYEFYISAMNNNPSAGYYDKKETAFVSIGDGLTSIQIADMYTKVQELQTSLLREV